MSIKKGERVNGINASLGSIPVYLNDFATLTHKPLQFYPIAHRSITCCQPYIEIMIGTII